MMADEARLGSANRACNHPRRTDLINSQITQRRPQQRFSISLAHVPLQPPARRPLLPSF